MNENKERFLGLLREVLTAGGALAFGAFDGLPSIIGLIVSIAAIGWALHHHEGDQIIATSIRKTLSLIPGVLLALNWVDPNTAASLASFLAPLFAIVWSVLDKDGKVKIPKSSGTALFALSASLALLTASCANDYATARIGFFKDASPNDPDAEFGVLTTRGDKLKPKPVEHQK